MGGVRGDGALVIFEDKGNGGEDHCKKKKKIPSSGDGKASALERKKEENSGHEKLDIPKGIRRTGWGRGGRLGNFATPNQDKIRKEKGTKGTSPPPGKGTC